ncbi:MAG: hypothetical protein [Olavius algarvensis Delta 4 endosymbiont]|nr:MAG: hypothetical protein [Olavius algarvensis Delta 4 endosymbiont]
MSVNLSQKWILNQNPFLRKDLLNILPSMGSQYIFKQRLNNY